MNYLCDEDQLSNSNSNSTKILTEETGRKKQLAEDKYFWVPNRRPLR